MIDFLCKLWPYLAGGLIGWLAAGWFARRLRHAEPPIEVEKIVEKVVEKPTDNPKHLALISKLETENKEIASLKTKLSGYESATPKTIDNPVHLRRIEDLEAQLKNAANNTPQTAFSETVKTADNPEHIKRIAELEVQLKEAQNAINNTPQAALSSTTNTIDNPEHLKRIEELEAQLNSLQSGPEIDIAAAKRAGFSLKSTTDLTAIEGIGPKINDLIHADGINSFRKLADSPVSRIQSVLDNAGPRYQIANPGTWPDQANLAANNRWPALKALQDVLIGGVYPGDLTKKSNEDLSTKASLTSGFVTDDKPKTSSESTSNIDKEAAKAAGFKLKPKDGQDDFTVVEGIGPKINNLIHDAGIHTYSELGGTLVETIQNILDTAGPSYTLAKPGTWPAQADMAAANKWKALKAWQDVLDGGK